MKSTNPVHRRTRFLYSLTAAVFSLTLLPLQNAAAEGDWDGDDLVIIDDLIPGDVNDDGEVSVIDVIVMQGYLHGHDNITILAPWNADVNDDGDVDIFDLGLTKRILLEGSLPPIPEQPTEPDKPTEPDPPETPTDAPPAVTDGKIYQKIALTDPTIGVVAYEGILPEGWTVQIASNWNNVSVYPGQEFVQFVSPDGKAVVQISSAQAYKQSNMHNTGVDYSDYTTYVPYMNAESYIDYSVQSMGQGAELVQKIEIPAEEQEIVEQYAASELDIFIQGVNSLGAQYGYTTYPVGSEGTMARQQYKIGDSYGEYSCAVAAFETYYQVLISTVQDINWSVLNTVSFEASDKEAFDQYYSDYEMIAANGYFTAAFYSANAYVSDRIHNMILDARNAANIEAAAKEYSSSGTTVSSDDTSTQERVFQAWDDYIKDEDRYTTTDGNQVTTSMFNETVAQDGDWFYVGSRTGIPDGFTELQKVTPMSP